LYKCATQPVKKPKRIARRSKKNQAEHRKYVKKVKQLAAENDDCEMRTPVCTGKMQGMQHKKRRGKNLMNHLLRSCNACNLWVELHPKEAMAMGLVISKFSK
jgi:hypothetical protein